jgi:hypothetical protein
VTTVARTLLDLSEVLSRRELERAFEAAERLEVLDLRALTSVVQRGRGRRGVRALGDLMAEQRPSPAATRSDFECRFLTVCRDAGLPPPAVNIECKTWRWTCSGASDDSWSSSTDTRCIAVERRSNATGFETPAPAGGLPRDAGHAPTPRAADGHDRDPAIAVGERLRQIGRIPGRREAARRYDGAPGSFRVDPAHDHYDHILTLAGAELMALWNLMCARHVRQHVAVAC